MTPTRSLTDRLLVRAWIEPSHERPLRVVVLHRGETEPLEERQEFLDAGSAAAFVRAWLLGLLHRAEYGEEPPTEAADEEGR